MLTVDAGHFDGMLQMTVLSVAAGHFDGMLQMTVCVKYCCWSL